MSWWRRSRAVQPEEYGTQTRCLVEGCDGQTRLIVSTESFDVQRQASAFGRVLVEPTVPVHRLECGHSVAYYTGS